MLWFVHTTRGDWAGRLWCIAAGLASGKNPCPLRGGGWEWGEVTTCRARVPDKICMGGATPVYRARMGIGMKRGGGKERKRRGRGGETRGC